MDKQEILLNKPTFLGNIIIDSYAQVGLDSTKDVLSKKIKDIYKITRQVNQLETLECMIYLIFLMF